MGKKIGYLLPYYQSVSHFTHMMNSFDWHTVVATPPTVIHGLSTVCPPFTLVPASSAKSCTQVHFSYQLFNVFESYLLLQVVFDDRPLLRIYSHKYRTLKPLRISGTTTSRSFSVIFCATASSISILSHSVTPRAYKSLRTFAQVIFP